MMTQVQLHGCLVNGEKYSQGEGIVVSKNIEAKKADMQRIGINIYV